MKTKEWLIFITLGVIWSSSFLWIKIAVREVSPATLVTLRVALGALAGIAFTIPARVRWPRDRRSWGVLALIGVTGIALPFLLISWGELHIDSAVASILNATVPLFTMLIAHLFLQDDRMSTQKVIGLIMGFGGVAVLMSRDLASASHASALGQAAVILAALFYAGTSVFARAHTEHLPGLVQGAAPLISASLFMGLAVPIGGLPFQLPRLPLTWLAVAWLGVLGSGLALVLWYYLLHRIGPTRTTMVTYIFPLGGVVLGVLFLGEALTWQLIFGAALIIAGIVVVNQKGGKTR